MITETNEKSLSQVEQSCLDRLLMLRVAVMDQLNQQGLGQENENRNTMQTVRRLRSAVEGEERECEEHMRAIVADMQDKLDWFEEEIALERKVTKETNNKLREIISATEASLVLEVQSETKRQVIMKDKIKSLISHIKVRIDEMP